MPVRALLVLLVMLNFGVATWWLLRPEPSPPLPWRQPDDVPRLELLGEAAADAGGGNAAAPADARDPADTPETVPDEVRDGQVAEALSSAGEEAAPDEGSTPGAAGLRCTSFGPFADASQVATARGLLQPLGAARLRVRDEVEAPRGWRVVMAAQRDRAAADELAAKIRAAGFDDLLVVPSGAEANGIALGRYGSEAAARRRESALRAAGFPALAQPLGDAGTRHWLDVAAGPGFDAGAARRAAGASQARNIDCAGIVDAATAG